MAMPAQPAEWTVEMVRALPDDSTRYEVIDGEPDLFVVPLVNGLPMRAWTDVGRLLLAVEVVSPSTRRTDRGRKRILYKEKAVPEYWIVDVDERTVERWRPDESPVEVFAESLQWHPEADIPPLAIDLPSYFGRVQGLA